MCLDDNYICAAGLLGTRLLPDTDEWMTQKNNGNLSFSSR